MATQRVCNDQHELNLNIDMSCVAGGWRVTNLLNLNTAGKRDMNLICEYISTQTNVRKVLQEHFLNRRNAKKSEMYIHLLTCNQAPNRGFQTANLIGCSLSCNQSHPKWSSLACCSKISGWLQWICKYLYIIYHHIFSKTSIRVTWMLGQ